MNGSEMESTNERTNGRTDNCGPAKPETTCTNGRKMNENEVRQWIEGMGIGHRYPRRHRQTQREIIPRHIRYGVFMRDGWRCILCGAHADHTQLHADHIQPWSYTANDSSQNLRTLCANCNISRSNYRIIEDTRRTLPIAAGCIDCEGPDIHDYGTLAYCCYCGYASYSQMVDQCWLQDCDCATP